MKTFLCILALSVAAACGEAPVRESTVVDNGAASQATVAGDTTLLLPVDVNVTRACATRSARLSNVQDGNYYTYSFEVDVTNSAANAGEFQLNHQGFLALADEGYRAPLPMSQIVTLTPISIGANATQHVSATIDSQYSFLNFWRFKVQTLHTRFPSEQLQDLIIKEPMDTNTEVEISACSDF